MTDSNPSIDHVLATRCDPLDGQPEEALRHFRFDHLPPALQGVSKHFAQLAATMVLVLPRCEQRTFLFQKLLEAKDCAVRAANS